MPNRRASQAKAATRPIGNPELDPGAIPTSHADGMMVVGVGASAGGLDAFTSFVGALPASSPMAFILVQHLDPHQPSLLAGLLQPHTAMPVEQAKDGATLQAGRLYLIPPGTYLAIAEGRIHLSKPLAPHGSRLPFDHLLQSLAAAYAGRAACVVLSGMGADGSIGLKAIAEQGGLVVAQEPSDAGSEGMPRNAIQTGNVDLVLPAADIPAALLRFEQRIADIRAPRAEEAPEALETDWLPDVIELLRTRTVHDFSLYKRGTIQRRLERRMAMTPIGPGGMAEYLALLRTDQVELERLAKSLLINVTSFFRDPKVFDYLTGHVIPDLIRNHAADQPIRLWVAGCSTGEETYSLAMIVLEQLSEAKAGIRLQVFASDVDAEAVAAARDGVYPATIEAEVSAARLKRFFVQDRETRSYRVLPELRDCVVFTVQDVLADPPFSRLDLVSCRNLLIYLRPEAQAKVISLFHFGLREGGVLLLGNSETVGPGDDRFEVIAKAERLYRHVGRSRPGDFRFPVLGGEGSRARTPETQPKAPMRQAALAELSRRLVLEAYGPAAVMINSRHECLYSMGPTGRYLRIAPGHPTHDLLAMAKPGTRATIRSAIQKALEQRARITVPGGRTDAGMMFDLDIQLVTSGGEDLLLICFVDKPAHTTHTAESPPQALELEQELETTRTELQTAIRELEISSEEQKAINEEALSVNEEYQSTNEELLTSKEELQSLNEELTALNSQLQETLECQRTTSDDLQNVLYSTDVATLFLDTDLAIRFFTPATRAMFHLIPGDVGRPLADLNSLSTDAALRADALSVLSGTRTPDREVETPDGASFLRRILPYRSQSSGVGGVVITFTDVTERNRVRQQLREAVRRSEQANTAKSRFLASASHDLRQPLQTLTLLHGLLARVVTGDRAQQLVARFNDTLGSMTGMLNTLLDINQIDAGIVRAEIVEFPIGSLMERLRNEFSMHAEAKGLAFHVINSSRIVRSDPALLEQMLRNLISNALKYTTTGSVLVGCRLAGADLRIEVWDTGIGIPPDKTEAVFEEYHQIDNAARERSRGLGLGLSIVRRLGDLIGSPVRVRSWVRRGSVFSIQMPLTARLAAPAISGTSPETAEEKRRTADILLVEDDPDVLALLAEYLAGLGHRVATAADGAAALELMARGAIRPELVLADYNLPGQLNGLQLGTLLRERFGSGLPVVILTGDISTGTLVDVAAGHCVKLNKPVQLTELASLIQRLLPVQAGPRDQEGTVFVVDDEASVREAIAALLKQEGRRCETFASCEAFQQAFQPGPGQCLVLDLHLPGLGGLDLLRRMRTAGQHLPSIVVTGSSEVDMVVEAMKAGASDFLEKPIAAAALLDSIARAMDLAHGRDGRSAMEHKAAEKLSALTARQHEIMARVLDGQPSKNIAMDLNISQRTVENHRAAIMHKTGSASLPALARLAIAAARANGTQTEPAPLSPEPELA